MLVGRIRLHETVSIGVEGTGVDDVQDKLLARTPAGFELVDFQAKPRKGTFTVDAVGTYERRDQMGEVEGRDLAAVREAVPAGWKLLYVRAA
jgi:hypothetical protein